MIQYSELIILSVAAAVLVVLILLLMSIRIVRQGSIYIVESFGKYYRTWEAGVHFKSPIGHRVVRKVCIKEQVADLATQSAITCDNICITSDIVVYFIITDPYKNVYGVENYLASLEKLTASVLYEVSSRVNLEEFIASKEEMGLDMCSKMGDCVEDWGLSIKRVEIKNIMLPDTVQEALEAKAKAERDKAVKILEAEGNRSAAIITAEAKKKKAILKAEQDKDSRIIRAEGKARAIEIIKKAEANGIRSIKAVGVDSNTVSLYKIDAMKKVADSQSSKVYLPTELMRFLDDTTISGMPGGSGKTRPKQSKPNNENKTAGAN